jgi:hypothetical protein
MKYFKAIITWKFMAVTGSVELCSGFFSRHIHLCQLHPDKEQNKRVVSQKLWERQQKAIINSKLQWLTINIIFVFSHTPKIIASNLSTFNNILFVYLLWATIEKIKITKFDSDSLTWFSNELICARHIFWIGTGIRWWNEKAWTFLSVIYYIGTRRPLNRLTNIVFSCKKKILL